MEQQEEELGILSVTEQPNVDSKRLGGCRNGMVDFGRAGHFCATLPFVLINVWCFCYQRCMVMFENIYEFKPCLFMQQMNYKCDPYMKSMC